MLSQDRNKAGAKDCHFDVFLSFIRVFRKLTKFAIMAILASEALLREKNPVAKCYPSTNRTQAASDSEPNTILSTLT